MTTNDAGRALIEHYERLELTAYRCPANIVTIGWGHTGSDVYDGMVITEDQAVELLERDLASTERGVTAAVTQPLTDNEFSACVALAFNIGVGHFRTSSVCQELNASNYEAACEHFQDWVNVAHKALTGLIDRRADEMALFSATEEPL